MSYQYNHHLEPHQPIGSVSEEMKLGLQLCGELLVESRHIILGAIAWKGWIEHGRCAVIVNLPDVNEFSLQIDLPMGILLPNEPEMTLFGADEFLRQYNPKTEGILVVCQEDKAYCLAASCIFTPGFPPQICYQEVKNRPSEFDFSWIDHNLFFEGV